MEGNFLERFLAKFKTKIIFLIYFIEFKKNKINRFEYNIMKILLSSFEEFGWDRLYQTHPDINLIGSRPTLCRYNIYGLEKFLNKKSKVLDIGSNVGFFSLYVAGKVHSVDMVEINPKLFCICKKAKEYLKVSNVHIFNNDIKKFKPDKKYDAIFSFAVHGHVGTKLQEYIALLENLLDDNGIILIESHQIKPNKFDMLETFLKEEQKKFKVIDEGVTDDNYGKIRKFYYLKKVTDNIKNT